MVDFWGRVSVAGCAADVLLPLCRVPSAASAGGKNAPDATSFGPTSTYAATLAKVGTRSSDIFPLYALSQPINTAGSCLVTVLCLKF